MTAYMPAHDSLEHCAVVGYLCQPNGNEIPARRSGASWLYTGMPAGPASDSSARIEPRGREDVVLIISILQVSKGRRGRFATKGVCQSRDEWLWAPALSPMPRLCLLEQIWGKILISLMQERKKHLPASTKGIISSYQCHVDLS